MTDSNFQWVIGADLRRSWAMERLESVNATGDSLIEEGYITYNELMYSQAWCIVAQSLLAASPEGGNPIDESAWKDLAEEKLVQAREAAGERGSIEKLDSAERSFDEGRYGAAIYDSVYVIETSNAEATEDINVTELVDEDRFSLWGQVYQSHAAFLLAQNQTDAAYSTAMYALGLEEATADMADAMAPAAEEEESVAQGQIDIALMGIVIGCVSFLLIVLHLLMVRRRHGNKRP